MLFCDFSSLCVIKVNTMYSKPSSEVAWSYAVKTAVWRSRMNKMSRPSTMVGTPRKPRGWSVLINPLYDAMVTMWLDFENHPVGSVRGTELDQQDVYPSLSLQTAKGRESTRIFHDFVVYVRSEDYQRSFSWSRRPLRLNRRHCIEITNQDDIVTRIRI